MVHFPSLADVNELRGFHDTRCVTMYLPLEKSATATNQNRISIKNAVKKAEAALHSSGANQHESHYILEPAQRLLEDTVSWPTDCDGLALYMSAGVFYNYCIPGEPVPYMLTIKDHFHVEPLLHILNENQHYYILALGHKNVRLFEGDMYGIAPISVKGFPASMEDMLHIDEYPKSRETHTVAPSIVGKGSEAYHEQYNVAQTDKAMLLEFFRRIDRMLSSFLNHHQKPVILAGVNYILPLYRKVNTYPLVLDKSITGNQDYPDLPMLRKKALNIIEERTALPSLA